MQLTAFPTGKVFWVLFILLAFVGGGTVGFMRLEGLSFVNALYLTAETLSTVGYGNVSPATEQGKVFS
ncbi:MAG: hypothetical protein GF355_06725, partial [Candidatus Eisenbacteria bacterium]|nr:hypothetical protein [Candidatus Eisenbacteria bacterium]